MPGLASGELRSLGDGHQPAQPSVRGCESAAPLPLFSQARSSSYSIFPHLATSVYPFLRWTRCQAAGGCARSARSRNQARMLTSVTSQRVMHFPIPLAFKLACLVAVAIVAATAGAVAVQPQTGSAQPHILLIIADDLGRADVGFNWPVYVPQTSHSHTLPNINSALMDCDPRGVQLSPPFPPIAPLRSYSSIQCMLKCVQFRC